MSTHQNPTPDTTPTTSSARRGLALGLATATLLGTAGLALAPSAQAGSPEGSNRGHQVSCSGKIDGKAVRVTVHDDDFALSFAKVKVGGRQGFAERDWIKGRKVNGAVKFAGTRASVTGTVKPVGKATPVHSTQEIGDDTFVTDGTRTKLQARLKITVGGKSAPLTCGQAYAFDTTTTKV